jgi:hypothetical protein
MGVFPFPLLCIGYDYAAEPFQYSCLNLIVAEAPCGNYDSGMPIDMKHRKLPSVRLEIKSTGLPIKGIKFVISLLHRLRRRLITELLLIQVFIFNAPRQQFIVSTLFDDASFF